MKKVLLKAIMVLFLFGGFSLGYKIENVQASQYSAYSNNSYHHKKHKHHKHVKHYEHYNSRASNY